MDDVDRVVYSFDHRDVEMRQFNRDAERLAHWTGRHDFEETAEGFEGKIVFRQYLDEDDKWQSWDFTNDHHVRLVVEGDTMRLYFRLFGEWDEAEYSPLNLRY